MQPTLVLVSFLAAQFVIAWFGFFLGSTPNTGTIFGISYQSPVAGILINQIKFLWVPIIINFLYGVGFHYGLDSFKSFLVVMALWLLAAPIAAVVFNVLVVKERLDLPTLLGLILLSAGSILIVAHKEISAFFS